ncbi:hypothetical protein SNEBB_002515 [Seison nebaliae]|nr:hypothetical protein SNEBB_002515 [Seison nebaliae]
MSKEKIDFELKLIYGPSKSIGTYFWTNNPQRIRGLSNLLANHGHEMIIEYDENLPVYTVYITADDKLIWFCNSRQLDISVDGELDEVVQDALEAVEYCVTLQEIHENCDEILK